MYLNKNIYKNILALFIGCISALIIAEVVLRIYNPVNFRVKGDKIILPANKKYVIKNKEDDLLISKLKENIVHTKNSLGFRGEEQPEDLSRYLSIITIGGSTTECTFLSDGKTWPDLLKNKLSHDFRDVWVNNAGLDGHSTFGHIVLMEDYIVQLKPDVVLFLIGANDQEREGYGEHDVAFMRNRINLNSIKQFIISMANHSEILSLGLNMYRYYKARIIGVDHAVIDFESFRYVDVDKHFTDGQEIFKKIHLPIYETKYSKEFENRLRKLIDIAKNNNIEPVLITQPTLYGDFIDDVTSIDFKFTKHSEDLLELYNDTTREVGSQENILVIDLAQEMPKSSKYYYDWYHFTNEGSIKVAEIIYNNLYVYFKKKYSKHLR
jgi:lysophospholipase L1-like esterase